MHVCDPFYPDISTDNNHDNRYSRSNSNDPTTIYHLIVSN